MSLISADGVLPQKISSGSFNWPAYRNNSRSVPLPLELVLLFGAGVIAVVLHQSFRLPLRMPGYHGMEWFAILVLARLASDRNTAGMAVGVGAAVTALFYAGGMGLDGKSAQAVTYLLQGCLIDAFLFKPVMRLPFYVWIPIAGSLAHMVSPITKNAFSGLSAGALQFGVLLNGISYPLMTHALFGAGGATIGLLVYLALAKRRT